MAHQISYFNQEQAIKFDVELFSPEVGYTLEPTMELAGQAVAASVQCEFPSSSRVLVICGSGNNGGDGLVAARHLSLYGFKVTVVYPKRVDRPLFHALVAQLHAFDITVQSEMPATSESLSAEYDLILDAIFGFSFKGTPRAPFDTIMDTLKSTNLPIVSVDIPSGWIVDMEEDQGEDCIKPYMLISLTLPKLCAKSFKGIHYMGGRFVPPAMAKRYDVALPIYPGNSVCVRIQ